MELHNVEIVPSSGMGIRPAPECKINCFHCIPEIVWELVFENLVQDWKTLSSCSIASSAWKEMLAKRKFDFMFPLVVPLLAKQLSSRELKKCREVSKNWKSGVDNLNKYFPQIFHHFVRLYCDHARLRSLPFRGSSHFNINTWRYRSPLLSEVITKSTNIFPSRVVHYQTHGVPLKSDLSYEINLAEISDKCVLYDHKLDQTFHKILEISGGHIWHLIISLKGGSTPENLHRNILKILHLVPNIVSLSLDFDHYSRVMEWEGFSMPQPCSPLDKLIALSIPEMWGASIIAKFLLASYGHQLESLECYSIPVQDSEDDDVMIPITLTKLETLKMWRKGCYLSKMYSILEIPYLQRVFLRLPDDSSPSEGLSSLLCWLAKFSLTLRHVHVEQDRTTGNSMDEMCSEFERRMSTTPEFPRLKFFSINSKFQSGSALRLTLRKFPALEELEFFWKDYKDYVWQREVATMWECSSSLRKISLVKSVSSLGGPGLGYCRGCSTQVVSVIKEWARPSDV